MNKTFLYIALVGLGLSLFLMLTGCTVQPKPPIAAAVSQPVPVAAPLPEGWQAVDEVHSAPLPQPEQPHRALPRQMPSMGRGGKPVVYALGEKTIVTCSEFGTVTIIFPMGERIKERSAGNPAEWMIEDRDMGRDLPIPFVTIRRAPFASSTEFHVTTDAPAVYQFILVPKAGGVSKGQVSLITMVNPETELRREENEARHLAMLEHERRARVIQAPQLNAATLRTYVIGGDNVPWKPVNVRGDHQSTIIEFPQMIETDQPILRVIEDGKERQVNTRPLSEEGKIGPRIVVDEPFAEARLIGTGGVVSIIGKGN